MKKILYIILALLMTWCDTYAQKETSWWYFGYKAGLNFNDLSNVKASDGAIVPDMPKPIVGPLNTREGCFTVSTYNGELLFSSDGMKVYDKNGNIMANGTGLLGDMSATQSGIAVPKPGSLTEYYVITVPAMAGSAGLRYSIVDISKNGGLGAVTSKNILIKGDNVYENIAAMPNANGKDYWLIHRSKQTFYVWAITAAGINPTPHFTISNSLIKTQEVSINNPAPQGELIISPDYKKIVSVNWGARQVISANLDFAAGTIADIQVKNCSFMPYGGTFSPNSEYLYLGTGFTEKGSLYVSSWNDLRKGAGMKLLAAGRAEGGMSNVKIGMDNRLYGIQILDNPEVGTKNLSVVMNPDAGGTDIHFFPNYLLNQAAFGLPAFAMGFIRIVPKEKPFACASHSRTYGIQVDLSGGNAPSRLEWNFGDGTPLVSQNVSSSQSNYTQQHTYNNAGGYTITVVPYKSDGTTGETITMQANIVNCSLKTNRMTRSELLNAKQLQN